MAGKVSSITIPRNAAGKYYASILADDGQDAAARPTCITRVAGYDLVLSHYLTGSGGGKVANSRHLVNAYRRLRRDSKALSRKKEGSANRRTARIHLAAQHERVTNARAGFQHKLSSELSTKTRR
ncbi:transposase [Candidatus Pantoea formicae]|uniref:transposase n=1 Tax=Candidatus Pantoea formicae TaxID=2608355 RepID=UPI003EDA9426